MVRWFASRVAAYGFTRIDSLDVLEDEHPIAQASSVVVEPSTTLGSVTLEESALVDKIERGDNVGPDVGLRHPSAHVRWAIVRRCAAKKEYANERLRRMLSEPEPMVRSAILHALGRHGGLFEDIRTPALSDPDPIVAATVRRLEGVARPELVAGESICVQCDGVLHRADTACRRCGGPR